MSISSERVLCVGGLDPTGGAGLARDASTITGLGGATVLVATASTLQDARGVTAVMPLDPDHVAEQMRIALATRCGAVKVGMLATGAMIEAVADALADAEVPVVLDPVLAASAGGALLAAEAVAGLAALRSVVTLLTPNLTEARALGDEDPAVLVAMGWRHVVVTGGDASGPEARDRYADAGSKVDLIAPRLPGIVVRGTGCAFASAAALACARGATPLEAARYAKGAVRRAIGASVGGYLGPMVAPVWPLAGHPFE